MSNNFIEMVTPLYIKAVKECKTPIFPVVLIAQAVLESAHGTSTLAREANNIAGIKHSEPFKGEKYYKYSLEELDNGKMVNENSAFCKFKNLEECILYHANFCQNNEFRKQYYQKVLEAKTIADQCKGLARTYATDSNYGTKLIDIINKYSLESYVKDIEKNLGNKNTLNQNKESVVMAVFNKPDMVDRRTQALGYPGTGAYRTRSLSEIKQIVWHYTATKHEGSGATIIKNHEAYWRNTHGWDIGGYHYYIDRQGVIYWNYDLTTVSYGAGKLNPQLCHISLEASDPSNYTQAQIKSREALTLWLCYTLGLGGDKVVGHKEVPYNSTSCPGYTVAQLDAFRKDLSTKLKNGTSGAATNTNTKNDRFVDLPDYKAPAKAYDELKVGQTVTIREGMNAWYDPSTKEGVKPSKDFKGDKDVIEKVMAVNAGYSKRAYLLKAKKSWILEQDLVEARQSWVAVEVKNDGTDKGKVELDESKNYVFIDGKYYDLTLRK